MSKLAGMQRVRYLMMAVAALLTAMPLQAQEAWLSVSVDSASIGERFTLSLVTRHNMMWTAHFPDPARGDTLLGDLEVLALKDSSHRYLGTASPGTRLDSVVYEVVTFALDTAYVPPLPVRFTQGPDTLLALTDDRLIPVRSMVPPDAPGIRGLAPLAPFGAPLWAWALLVGAAVLLVALIAYYILSRRRTEAEEPASPPAPPPTPYEAATARLRALEETDLDDARQIKPFFVELADLLRTYLERRLGVAALEETTSELVRDLERLADRRRIPGDVPYRVRRALTLADLAKFADARPTPDESRTALHETRTALDEVEQALQPPPSPQPSVDAAPQAVPSQS